MSETAFSASCECMIRRMALISPVSCSFSLFSEMRRRIPDRMTSDLPEYPMFFWSLSISCSMVLLSDTLIMVMVYGEIINLFINISIKVINKC